MKPSRSEIWVRLKNWRTELVFAVPIVALVIFLYYSWFVVRDRYFIFLYYHDMGAGFDTTPFGRITVGRYWMTGLVAGGAVMVLYIAANFLLGRILKNYRAPVWWRVWILCAIPLLIVIPAIVMTASDPVLPWVHALPVTGVCVLALGLAVALGQYAATYPLGYILLMIDGVGLALVLMALHSAEGIPGWLARGSTTQLLMFVVLLAAGVLLLLIMSGVYYAWGRTKIPDTASLLVAGAGIHYLVLPIYHHLFRCTDNGSWRDPDYFTYIPSAATYFPRSPLFQVGVWVGFVLLGWGLTRLRFGLRRRRDRKG